MSNTLVFAFTKKAKRGRFSLGKTYPRYCASILWERLEKNTNNDFIFPTLGKQQDISCFLILTDGVCPTVYLDGSVFDRLLNTRQSIPIIIKFANKVLKQHRDDISKAILKKVRYTRLIPLVNRIKGSLVLEGVSEKELSKKVALDNFDVEEFERNQVKSVYIECDSQNELKSLLNVASDVTPVLCEASINLTVKNRLSYFLLSKDMINACRNANVSCSISLVPFLR